MYTIKKFVFWFFFNLEGFFCCSIASFLLSKITQSYIFYFSWRKCCHEDSVLDARTKSCVPHQTKLPENLQILEYKIPAAKEFVPKKFKLEYGET